MKTSAWVLLLVLNFASVASAEVYEQTMTDSSSKRLAKVLDGRRLECSPDDEDQNDGFYPITLKAQSSKEGILLSVETSDPERVFSGSGEFYELEDTPSTFILKAGDDGWNILYLHAFTKEDENTTALFTFQGGDMAFSDPVPLSCTIKK